MKSLDPGSQEVPFLNRNFITECGYNALPAFKWGQPGIQGWVPRNTTASLRRHNPRAFESAFFFVSSGIMPPKASFIVPISSFHQ